MLESYKKSKTKKYCELIGKYTGVTIGLVIYLIIVGYALMFKLIIKKLSKEEKKDGVSSSKCTTNE